jgi:hypothetical protein
MTRAAYFADNSVPALVKQIQALPCSENEIVLLLIGEHSTFDVNALLAALREQQIPVAGGVFPGVIYGDQRYEAGLVADVLPLAAQPNVITGLDAIGFSLDQLPEPSEEQYTALVLVDGLTKHVALFLDRMFRELGNAVSYIGGGAGSLSFQQKPCVFDSKGIYQDAALILWVKATATLGVRHGWQRSRGPFVASHTEGTLVQQLNNQPAFQLYSQYVEQRAKIKLTKENFFSIAKEYPLGIYHPGMDFIVRDPITFTDDKALVCVGEVPRGAMIYILHGNKQSLVDHAHMATTEAMQNSAGGQHNLIVDCISRVLYLEADFSQELNAVIAALPAQAPTPYGILSLGEIATFQTGRVEFFNKTFVVGSLQHTPSLN